MAAHNERPVIFPLSNPTANSECTAQEAYDWTDGRVIFASGSPFGDVAHGGSTYAPSQCNNMFVFPGLGLGVTLAGAKTVSDRCLYQCAVALSGALTEDETARGQVFPSVSRIREVSHRVAIAAARQAFEEGHATKVDGDLMSPLNPGALETLVKKKMYEPVYVPLVHYLID